MTSLAASIQHGHARRHGGAGLAAVPAGGPALPHATVPAAPTGEGVEIVVNADAGESSAALAQFLDDALPDAVVRGCLAGDYARAVELAASRCRVLGVAGGDGSVSVAAAYAWKYRLPLLILPAGKDNWFAGALGLDSVDRALKALAQGSAAFVDVPCADEQIFLKSCMTSASQRLVERCADLGGGLLGRLSAARGLLRGLRAAQPQDVLLEGRRRRLWLLCAVNGETASSPADGLIGVRVVDAEQPLARVRTVLALLFGDPIGGRFYERSTARALDLRAPDGPLDLVLDGEDRLRTRHVLLHKVRCALTVYDRS